MDLGAAIAHSTMQVIALVDEENMEGRIGSYGVSRASEPRKVDALQLEYRGPESYVSIEVGLPTSPATAIDISPAELSRIGLKPDHVPSADMAWHQSPRAVLIDGEPVYGAEANRRDGWEFRGFLDDAEPWLRLQIIAFGFDRDPVALRRADPLPFIPRSWRWLPVG